MADMEMIRVHLGIDRWIVMGLSWGSTLGLAYALAHRDRVLGLVLGSVTTTSRREVDWITEQVGAIFPREWERLAAAVPVAHREKRLVDAYADMLADPDETVRRLAAEEWCRWEDAHVSLAPGAAPYAGFHDPEFRYRFARLVTHYWRNTAFHGDSELLDRAAELNGIPGALVHGRFDVSSPLGTAWELSKRWTTSTLTVIEDGGHGTGPSFAGSLIAAIETVAERAAA
jgi:proline iminopeptidase